MIYFLCEHGVIFFTTFYERKYQTMLMMEKMTVTQVFDSIFFGERKQRFTRLLMVIILYSLSWKRPLEGLASWAWESRHAKRNSTRKHLVYFFFKVNELHINTSSKEAFFIMCTKTPRNSRYKNGGKMHHYITFMQFFEELFFFSWKKKFNVKQNFSHLAINALS